MATSPRLDAKIPDGQLSDKWTKYRSTVPLVNPANKRNIEIIVVGTGLAGFTNGTVERNLVHFSDS